MFPRNAEQHRDNYHRQNLTGRELTLQRLLVECLIIIRNEENCGLRPEQAYSLTLKIEDEED
jgi:hypothetical protein